MKKYLSLLAVASFAFTMQACSDTSSTSAFEEDESSSSEELDESSSSGAKNSSSSKEKSSSSVEKSSSSDAKSSASEDKSSSSENKSSSSDAESSSSVSEAKVYVFGSDYTSGELRWIEDGQVSKEKLSFYQDSKLIAVDSNLFVLERSGADNVSLVGKNTNKVVWQVELDDYSNPADVVKANDKEVWVALNGTGKFVKLSLDKGAVTKTVETSAFAAEGETSPYLVDFEVSGDTLFALFQRYIYDAATWSTTFSNPGLIAMYKLSDGALLDTIRLAKKNPTAMGFANGKLYVASMSEYNDAWGTDADSTRGIEEVDVAAKTSTLVVSGEKLGGGVYAFAVDAENAVAYAAIYKSYGSVPAVVVDLSAKSVKTISGVADIEGSVTVDAVTGAVYAGDRTYGDEALYVYEAGKVTKVKNADSNTLPPYSIAIVR